MRLRLVNYGLVVVIGLLTPVNAAWSAQQPAAVPATGATPPAAPTVIAVTDVIPSGERALAQLRDIRSALDNDQSVNEVESGLPAFAEQLDDWWKSETMTIEQLHSVQRINDVVWQLHLYEGQVATWNGLLTASSRKWSAEKEGLGRLIADWQATQQAMDNTAPAAVNNKIADVLREADATQRLFQQKTAQLVSAQGKLAARLKRLNEIGEEIEEVRHQSNSSLLSLDSPPLWSALFSPEPSLSLSAQYRDSAMKLYRDGVNFFQLSRKRLPVHLALFLVLMVLFLRLRHLSRKPGLVSPTDAELFVLDRSFASALLVALLSVPILYSDASPQMMRMILIPAVVPLMMLLPAIFSRPIRIAIYMLTVLYMLDFWRYYLPPQWWPARISLLLEALLGIGIIYLTREAKSIAPATASSRASLLRTVSKVAIGVLMAGIGANLIGDLALAEILFTPLVRILYLGVVIRMLTVVATTFAMMALRSPLALLLRTVQDSGKAVAANIRKFANIVAVGLWVVIGLFNIGVYGYSRNAIQDILESTWKLGAMEISLGEIATFVVVLGSAYAISRALRFILAKEIYPRFQMPRGVPDVLDLVARYGVLLFGFLLALISTGVNLSQLTLALSALGVGIGFGLQNIVNNFVCGLILVFEHPIQVGDFVEVGPHFGKVQRIGFRSSSLNTFDGGNVIIPNSELIGTKVMNWSLSNQLRRVTLKVPVPVGTEPKHIIDMLQALARSQPEVVSYPSASAAMETFGDGSLRFIVRCWTQTEKFESVCFGLTLAINNAFQAEGIQIPFAQTDVHLHWPGKEASEIQSVEKLNQAAAGVAASPKSTAGS